MDLILEELNNGINVTLVDIYLSLLGPPCCNMFRIVPIFPSALC